MGDGGDGGEWIVRARGLPFSACSDEVTSFFSMCRIKDGKDGIHFVYLREGRPSGEVFVEFESEKDFNLALEKNNGHMGHRYIEVFGANKSEMDWVMKRQGAGGDALGQDGVVRLRGLPYEADMDALKEFFSGYDIIDNGIYIQLDAMGRSAGEAYVQFASQEHADAALAKDHEKMGHSLYSLHPYAWFTFPGN